MGIKTYLKHRIERRQAAERQLEQSKDAAAETAAEPTGLKAYKAYLQSTLRLALRSPQTLQDAMPQDEYVRGYRDGLKQGQAIVEAKQIKRELIDQIQQDFAIYWEQQEKKDKGALP